MRLLGALTSSYLLFWSPLFLVTVFSWGDTWDTGTIESIEATQFRVYMQDLAVKLSRAPRHPPMLPGGAGPPEKHFSCAHVFTV